MRNSLSPGVLRRCSCLPVAGTAAFCLCNTFPCSSWTAVPLNLWARVPRVSSAAGDWLRTEDGLARHSGVETGLVRRVLSRGDYDYSSPRRSPKPVRACECSCGHLELGLFGRPVYRTCSDTLEKATSALVGHRCRAETCCQTHR